MSMTTRDKIERREAANMRKALRRSYERFVRAIKTGTTPTAALEMLDVLVYNQEVTDELFGLYKRIMPVYAGRRYDEVYRQKGQLPEIERKNDILTAYIQSYITTVTAKKITENTAMIYGTTLSEIRRITLNNISLATEYGWGVSKIATNIENGLSISTRWRALRIAATEVNSAINTGHVLGAKATGFPLKKKWSTGGSNVRDSHRRCEAEGWIADDKAFSNRLMYPGDSGPAEEVVNCKCTIQHKVA